MRSIYVFNVVVGLFVIFTGCSKNEADKVKDVIVTIYEDTGYGSSLMSDILTEPLQFSDNDGNSKNDLTDILTVGIDIYTTYERGYRYTYKAKKIWMNPPPMDVSNIKYQFTELVSKEKVITDDSENDIILFIDSEKIKFLPRFPSEYENDGTLKFYDALHAQVEGTTNWMGIIEIENFTFEAGYEYRLSVKEIIQAEPFVRSYSLIEVLSKEKKN